MEARNEKEKADRLESVGPAQERLCQILGGKTSSVTILVGDHGSEKTTRLPALVSQLSIDGSPCRSLVAQPNAINAEAAVHWMSGGRENMTFANGKLSDEVLSSQLAHPEGAKSIEGYIVVFVDDAHCRSVATELLLLRIKGILAIRDASRNPINFVVISTNPQIKHITKYFSIAKSGVLRLSALGEGAAKPHLTLHYATKSTFSKLSAVYSKIKEIVDEKAAIAPAETGILVFLRNNVDVKVAFDHCRNSFPEVSCKVLDGSIRLDGPNNAVTGPAPKIVLTTDSAALGLTVEHIHAVIVTGTSEASVFILSIGNSLLAEVGFSVDEVQQQAWRVGLQYFWVDTCYIDMSVA